MRDTYSKVVLSDEARRGYRERGGCNNVFCKGCVDILDAKWAFDLDERWMDQVNVLDAMLDGTYEYDETYYGYLGMDDAAILTRAYGFLLDDSKLDDYIDEYRHFSERYKAIYQDIKSQIAEFRKRCQRVCNFKCFFSKSFREKKIADFYKKTCDYRGMMLINTVEILKTQLEQLLPRLYTLRAFCCHKHDWETAKRCTVSVTNVHNVDLSLYGVIIGDMAGSLHEFKNQLKTTDFEFLPKDARFTDDTVCALAVAKGLSAFIGRVTGSEDGSEYRPGASQLRCEITNHLLSLCNGHPDVGYGGKFREWLKSQHPRNYNSYGNGSAMRVAACAMLSDDLRFTQTLAGISAGITHGHKEGEKGACAVADVMWRTRHGQSKETIRAAIEKEYGYNLHRTIEEIRPDYKFDVTCQGSVPESIIAFLEGNSYEECVRLAISLGGDSDTQGAITGAMASMMYPIPEEYIEFAKSKLAPDLLDVAEGFRSIVRTKTE